MQLFNKIIYCNKPTMCQKIWIQQNKKKYVYISIYIYILTIFVIILICYLPYLIDFQHSLTYGSIHQNHCFRSWHIFIIFSLYIYIFFHFYSFYQMFCMMWQENNKMKQKRVILFNKGSWIRRLTAKLLSVRSVRCQKYGQIVKINCDSV